MAALNFNARNVAPELPRNPIPAGVYLAHIIDSDVVPTKTGGEMVKLTHEILDGPCKGRKVFSNINTKNANAEAERIGQAQLSALCHAVDVMEPRDSSMLHFIPLRMRVTIRPEGPDKNGVHREAQNEVRGYEGIPRGGVQPQPRAPSPSPAFQRPAASAPAAPTAAAPAPRANPWARRSTATA